VLAAIDPTHAFAKPSALDQEILEESKSFSQALHGSLHVMHAYLPLPLTLKSGASSDNRLSKRVLRAANLEARQLFDKALVKTKIPVSHRHLIQGNSVEAILRVARKTRSTIVVMGAISRSGLKRLFIGNTSDTVMDQISCDLLVVKPKHFSLRVPRARRGIQYFSAALHA
jgi:universal stress protein E